MSPPRPPSGQENRRRHARYPFTDAVQCRAGSVLDGSGVDISVGGIGFTTAHELSPGTPVEIVLLNNSVSIKGEVRFRREAATGRFRVGVAFEQPQVDIVDVVLMASGC